MHADQGWIIAAVLTLTGIVGWLYHHYVEPVSWWPVVGRKWRAWYWAPSYLGGHTESPWATYNYEDAQRRLEAESEPEDDWADELHVINLAVHRDRPIAQLTHYEIEAVIKDLGRADWLPERYKAAA